MLKLKEKFTEIIAYEEMKSYTEFISLIQQNNNFYLKSGKKLEKTNEIKIGRDRIGIVYKFERRKFIIDKYR